MQMGNKDLVLPQMLGSSSSNHLTGWALCGSGTCTSLPNYNHLACASPTAPSPSQGIRNQTSSPGNSTGLQHSLGWKGTGQKQVRQGGNHRATYGYYKLSFPSFHFTNVAMIKKGTAQNHNKKEWKGQDLNAALSSPSDFSADAQGCPIKTLPPLLQIWQ